MKNILLILTGIVYFVSPASPLFSLGADSFLKNLSVEQKTVLSRDGEITRYFFQKEDLKYIFDSSFSQTINKNIGALNPTIGVESLFLYKTDKEFSVLDLYNILLSISTMKGIEYYSQSRKRMRTLFTDSYVLQSKENKVRIPDFTVTNPLEGITFYADQIDKTFGENIYKTEYKSDGETIWIRMSNETPMKYKFIRMVNPGDTSINVKVRKVDEGLLFYGVTGVHTFSFLGLERAKKESFYNRIKALYGWFTNSLEK